MEAETETETISPLFNPLNTELNPICHLLTLLGAHPIFHISSIRVNVPFIFEQLQPNLCKTRQCYET